MTMEWSEEKLLQLAELYKLQPNLWDPKNKDYFKKDKRADAWNEIASAVGTSAEACKKKTSSLLAVFRKEKIKVKLSMGTGKGADEVYSSRWFAYEAFRFLEDRDRPRQGLNTEQMVDTEEEMEDDNSQQEETGDGIQNAQETNDARSQSSTIPTPPKRVKKKEQLQQTLMADAIGLMRTASSKLKNPLSDTPEEVKSFGNYIISKMKSYSDQTRKCVEHAIFDILIKADRGYYENPIPSTSTALPPQHMLQVFPSQPQYPCNYSQPYISHPNLSRVHKHTPTAGTPPQGSLCSSSTPSPRSPDFVHQQAPDSLLTLSQSRPYYDPTTSNVHDSFPSSNQSFQYSSNAPSTHSDQLSDDSNALS